VAMRNFTQMSSTLRVVGHPNFRPRDFPAPASGQPTNFRPG
jgi:hypothetical protein